MTDVAESIAHTCMCFVRVPALALVLVLVLGD